MWNWLITTLAEMQGALLRTLASELRAGGAAASVLALCLGALHALTPGHGKAALSAYLLGREARLATGLQIALGAALLHVLSGFTLFLVLRFIVDAAPSMLGRGSPTFTIFGYALIIVAGAMMIYQSLRPVHDHSHDGSLALVTGIGLLPCPLTISVLGFAWLQSSAFMVAVSLVSLALGIALTIGLVALLAIISRRVLGVALSAWGPRLERGGRIVQGIAGVAIVAIGVVTLVGAAQ